MANQNSVAGFYSLPAQSITGTTETALVVPAAGNYSLLPSPAHGAGNGLWIGAPADIQYGEFDGHPFKVRVAGKVHTGGSITFLCNLYYVPSAIASADTAGTLSNDTAVVTNAASSAFSGDANFLVEAEFLWDSTSKKLNGFVTSSQVNGANVAPNSGSAGTNVATTQVSTTYTAGSAVSLLNFIPSFTFGTGNAANSVTVTEFVIDRV